jgi:X-X-X-Leu-X-X-Gly heptad repeat protein
VGVVHSADRLWDALAMLMIVAGTTLFLLARNGLASLANGTQTLPAGVTSYVQRADYFSAQSSLGLLMIGAGVAVGLVAAIRHALRRRA